MQFCKNLALLIGLSCLSLSAQENPPAGATNPPAQATAAAEPAKAEQAPTLDPNARNIRFQFEGIPYMDVVQRFAQMANKPLITETNIDGTVTFNDPKPYTYPEAFETLNTILSMKSAMLVENDRYLRLVPFKDIPQMPLKIFRGLDQTGDVRAGEIVTVLLELKNLDAGEVAKSITPMLSNAGSVAPLSRGRGLILTDRLGHIQRVKNLIAEIDTSSSVKRQMKTYSLIHASGALVADLLNKTFGAATAPKRTIYNEQAKQFHTQPPDPDDYITAIFDEASRTLVLYGPAERMTMAEDLIRRFEDRDGARGGEIKIYYPRVTKVDELARMIRQAIPGVAAEGESGSAAATKARVIVDTSLNRLIVTAPIAGQLDSIENLINRVEGTSSGDSGVADTRTETIQLTKVFRLQVADPSAVFRVVTNAFTRRLNNGNVATSVKGTLDENTKTIVLTGSPGDLQHAIGIIEQMDQTTKGDGPQETVFIEFGSASELKRLQPLIKQLYESQVVDPRTPGAAHARLLPEPEMRRLIVTATKEHVGIIQKIAQQLRSPAVSTQPREFRAITIKSVKVDQIFKTVSDLVTERMNDELFADVPKPLLLADAPNNRILITANASQFEQIEEIVKTVDTAPTKIDRQISTIQLQNLTAPQVMPNLQQLMQPLVNAHTDAAGRPEVIADSTGKQLIVSASATDLEKIREIVRQLEGTKTGDAAREFKTIKLYNRSAPEVVTLAEQLYKEQLKGQPTPAGGPASFLPEAKGNRVIVIGSTDELARAEAIIRQLDPALEKGDKEETRVIRLKNAMAQDLASLVEKSLDLDEEKVKLLVDTRSNSLVISGSTAAVEAAARIIEQLDSEPNLQQREIKIIDLKSSEASRIVPMINEVFPQMMRDQRGANYTVQSKVTADPGANRIIVTGGRDELQQITALVQKLDQAPEQSDTTRVFKLQSANASEIAKIVSEAMVTFDQRNQPIKRVSVSADDSSNTLVVSGSRADLQDVAVVIEKIDGDAQRKGKLVKIIELETDEPSKLVTLAQQVWTTQTQGRAGAADVSLTLEPSGKRVIVLAPATLMAQVEQVLTGLDQKPDGAPRTLQVVELKQRNASTVLPVVSRIYEEQEKGKKVKPATIVADNTNTRLMIFGSEEQFGVVKSIVEKLATQSTGLTRQTKFFEMGNQQTADRLMPIAQQLYRDQLPNLLDGAAPDAQFLVDATTARLIVSAREDHLEVIGKIVEQLLAEKVPNQERETKMFEVGYASEVTRLLPLVQQLYREQTKSNDASNPPDAQFLPDEKGGRIIVTARPAQLPQIETIIKQLTVANPKGKERETRIYNLNATTATELVTTLRAVYTEELKKHPEITPEALILPDQNANRLIISGLLEEIEIIEGLVKRLDEVSPVSANTRMFQLKTASVDQVSSILSTTLVQRERATGRNVARVSIGVDLNSNNIIVSGLPADLNAAASIIEQLDSGTEQYNRQVRILPLKAGKAADLAVRIKQLYTEQMRGTPSFGPADALILGDAVSDRLIIVARENQIETIEKLTGQLDELASETGRQLRVITVKNNTATAVSSVLTQLYTIQIANTDPLQRMIVTTGLDNKTLFIDAPKAQLEKVGEVIAQLETGAASNQVRETKLYNVGVQEIIRVQPLLRQLYESELKGQGATELPDAQMLADPQTGRLIVTARPEHQTLIEKLLSQLQPHSGSPRQTKILEIGPSEEVTRVTPLLQQLYKEQLRGQEATEPADAQFIPDAQAGRIIVTARAGQLEQIATLLGQLRSSTSASRETRIYNLSSATATELSTTVNALYLEEVRKNPAFGINKSLILPDALSNRLIVSGPTNQLPAIEEIIKSLDQVSPQMGGTRVFKLKAAGAEQVATVLSTALVRFEPSIGRRFPRISIGSDTNSNSLIISGEARDLNAAASIIEQLDTTANVRQREMRILTLKSGRATDLASKVQQLYQEQMKSVPDAGPADALIIGDTTSDRLLITATEQQHAVIEKLVTQLDDPGDKPERAVRILPLKRNSAYTVSAIISQLFTRELSLSDVNRKLVITPAPNDRTLVIEGTPEILPRVEELVKSLDVASEQQNFRVRSYQLGEAKASELAPTLARLFEERRSQGQRFGGGPSSSQPRFEFDATSNVLLVGATEEQFTEIGKLIEELQATALVANEIRSFTLTNSVAEQIVPILVSMLGADDPATAQMRRERPWRVTTDSKNINVAAAPAVNAVIVQGPPSAIRSAEQIIRNLDGAENQKGIIQTVRLKKASPQAIAEAVNTTLAARAPKTNGQRANITPVENSNSVLIDGPRESVDEIIKIIQQLDEESTGGDVEIRIYKLEHGKARELSSLINQMLQTVLRQSARMGNRGFRGGGGGNRDAVVNITPDERTNSLIVSANPEHFKTIEQLLMTLDQNSATRDRTVRFVLLKNARALEVANQLTLMFEDRSGSDRPVIESDSFANSLTIIASKSDLAEIDSLIETLDQTARDETTQVRMLVINGVPADQMATMLKSLYGQMSRAEIQIVDRLQPPPRDPGTNQPPAQPEKTDSEKSVVSMSVDRTSNALLLSGPSHELDAINNLVDELTWSSIGADAEFRQFQLKEADPVVVARTLTELFKPDPIRVPQRQGQQGEPQVVTPAARMTVVAEPRTRSIIVRGKATDFLLLEPLLEKLDSPGTTAQLSFKLVPLAHADPQKIAPLVNQVVQQLGLTRPGDPVSVMPDVRTRSMFVVARESMSAQVQEVIKGLDTPPAFAQAEVALIPLKNTAAAQVAIVLQNMLKPGTVGELTPEAVELLQQVKSLRLTNDLGQPVVLDLTKPIKIMADTAPGGGGANRLMLSSTADNLKALTSIVEMMDTVAVVEGVTFKIVQLANADASSVAETLTQIFQQGQRLAVGPSGPAQPDSETGKALTQILNVSAERRSNSLVLSGKPETVELAQRLIRDLDGDHKGFITEVKIFRLNYASASRLSPMLQAVFMESGTVPGAEGLNTQITRLRTVLGTDDPKTSSQPKTRAALTVQPDQTSNTLIIAARSDMMPLIEDVIKGLDVPAASGMESVRIYPLKKADASRLQQIVSDIYNSPGMQLRPEEKPGITVDTRTNALIVSGNDNIFAMIEMLLAQLDRDLPYEYGEFRTFVLKNADASQVAAVLQRILDARAQQKAVLTAQPAALLRAIVIGDARSNSLIVGGSPDVFEIVEALSKQMDAEGESLAGQIRIIPLKNANAGTLSVSLNSLFSQRYQAARNQELARNRPIILPDSRMNSMLVSAGVEDSKSIDDLIAKLDIKPEDPALSLTVIGLEHNDSSRVAVMLQNVFMGRLQSMMLPGQTPSPSDRVVVNNDPLSNALIISANKENLELIRELLQKVDVEPTVDGGVIQIFTLVNADAQRVATMLRSLISQGLYRPGMMGRNNAQRSREAMAVTVDSRSNTLIVSASPENLAVIKEVIKQVDSKEYSLEGDIKLYSLKNARASLLATTLQQFFQQKRAGEMQGRENERSLPLTIVADDRVNTLLVTGGKEHFDAIDRMVSQLDTEEVFDKTNFRVFALKNSTAVKLQGTLQRLFQNRPARFTGRAAEPITVVADSWANALVVGASIEDMGMVSSLIETLDNTSPESGMQVQVLQLRKADARSVAQTIQGLYRDGPGTPVTVRVDVDERLNAIVVSAGETDIKRISELVAKLDTDMVARVAEIRIFPLKFAQAEEMVSVITTAMTGRGAPDPNDNPNRQSMLQFITRTPEGEELVASALKESVLVTSDRRRNALVVSAPVDSMNLLSRIIQTLDAEAPQLAKIKVFKLENADARQMSDVLSSLFRLRAVPGQPVNQRAIQYTLVKDDGVTSDISATIGSAEQGALTVTVDLRTNSLLIGGTDHYVKLASEIITELDLSPAMERKTEVYRLRNSRATEVSTALTSFLAQDKQQLLTTVGEEGLGTVQRLVEREVAIVAEPISNTLLVSASPRYFEQFKSLIEELDQPQQQVLIQCILAEVTLDKTTDLGVEWAVQQRIDGNTIVGAGTGFGVADELKRFGGFSSSVTGDDFSFILRALESDGRLEVLSRPQILTADNQEATIDIGQRVPLITDSRVTERGDTINSFRYENVGVSLTVTPRISPDGFVKMDVEPTISQISSANVTVSPGVIQPIISERRATTTVSVQNGQSVIIGGLISATDDQRRKKVPVLGNIPYLGALFRSTKAIKDRKELLIILTPQLLRTGKEYDDAKVMTEDHLRRSSIKDQLQRDKLQQQILEPLLPIMDGDQPVKLEPVQTPGPQPAEKKD